MGTTTASVDLPYSAATVFRVATRVEDLPRWMPEVAEATLLDPAMAVGSQVRLRLSQAAAGAVISGRVEELRAPESIVISGSGGPVGVVVRVTLDATSPASTRIHVALELTTPAYLGFIAKEAERRIKAELPASLERFRALVEAEPADPGQA
jgi:uncharacterized protein YndB with AHSA1/START domain